jgi:hypothetical protein
MKSDTLVTLLMGILAVFFGVINAKNKKKKTQPGKQIPDVRGKMLQELFFHEELQVTPSSAEHEHVPEDMYEHMAEEAPRSTVSSEEPFLVKNNVQNNDKERVIKKLGFDVKKAVLFSEIMKPKFEEFVDS